MKSTDRHHNRFLGEQETDDQRLRVVTDGGAVAGFASFGRCRDPDGADMAELFAINLDPTSDRSRLLRTQF